MGGGGPRRQERGGGRFFIENPRGGVFSGEGGEGEGPEGCL